jgi:hypothetical protein
MPKHGLVMLKTWAQTVSTHQFPVASMVGLYPAFLPTIKTAVSKWVDLYKLNPQEYTLLFPTHFWLFTSVKNFLSTLSTPPIMNRNYVKIEQNKGVVWL